MVVSAKRYINKKVACKLCFITELAPGGPKAHGFWCGEETSKGKCVVPERVCFGFFGSFGFWLVKK
jgi:hypothetical protein